MSINKNELFFNEISTKIIMINLIRIDKTTTPWTFDCVYSTEKRMNLPISNSMCAYMILMDTIWTKTPEGNNNYMRVIDGKIEFISTHL
jgi:hypothetical protein